MEEFVLHTMRVSGLGNSLIPRLSSLCLGMRLYGGVVAGLHGLNSSKLLIVMEMTSLIPSLGPILVPYRYFRVIFSLSIPKRYWTCLWACFSNDSWCGLRLGCVAAVVSSWGGEGRGWAQHHRWSSARGKRNISSGALSCRGQHSDTEDSWIQYHHHRWRLWAKYIMFMGWIWPYYLYD